MKKVFFFTNIFPHYRKIIWSLLLNEKRYSFEIFYSSKRTWGIQSYNPKEYNFPDLKLHNLKNYFLFDKLFWQTKVLKVLFFKKYEIVIFTGEMSVLSTWIGAVMCRIFKKKVIFWGHGIYGNEGVIKRFFRVLFLKLADINLVYENRAKKLLINQGFKKDNIKVVYNSLDYDFQLELFKNLESETQTRINYFKNTLPVVIFVGRLSRVKQINTLIRSVALINSKSPKVNLLIVGNGPEKQKLESLARKEIIFENYRFLDAIYDEIILSKLFYKASICVSPGNIGLTGIHSLSYGTPIGSHNNYINQMPEVDAIIDGENGFLFKEGDEKDLSNKIIYWLNKSFNRSDIRKIIDQKYNPYFQKTVFDKLIISDD